MSAKIKYYVSKTGHFRDPPTQSFCRHNTWMVPYLELAALFAASMNVEFLRFSGPPPIFNPLTFPAKAENLLLPRLIRAFVTIMGHNDELSLTILSLTMN